MRVTTALSCFLASLTINASRKDLEKTCCGFTHSDLLMEESFLLRCTCTILQAFCLLAVFIIACRSVAVASSTSTVPASSLTTGVPGYPVSTSSTNASSSTAGDVGDVAQGGSLSDIPAGHWAYDAVGQLVKDGLIVGYPDGQFKGRRPMTRYEAAVLTYRAVDQIETEITAGKAVNQADIDVVRKLMAAFAEELKRVEAQVAALQTKVDSNTKQLGDLKAEADATQLRVNQGKIGFNILARPGTSSFVLNGTTAAGAPIAAGTTVAFGTGANNLAKTGALNTGIMYSTARVFLGGQIDPRWSYGARLADAIKYSPFDATSTTPSYCAGATAYTAAANCGYTVLNYGTTPPQNTLPLNLDYAYVQYSSPGGLTSQIGRYAVGAYGRFGNGPYGSMLFGGQSLTGANLGYSDPRGRFYAAFYFGQQSVNQSILVTNGTNTNAGANNLTCTQGIVGLNTTAPGNGVAGQGKFTSINPYCTAQQMEDGGWLVYYFSGPRIAVGGAVDSQQGKQFTFYNPTEVSCTTGTGAALVVRQAASAALCSANYPTATVGAPASYYLNGQTNAQVVEGYLSAYLGPMAVPTFNVAIGYTNHLGTNPFTGGVWQGSDSETFAITYASKGNLFAGGGYTNPWITGGGRRNSNVYAIDAGRFGRNSLGNIQNAPFSGPLVYQNNIGLTDINGLQSIGFQAAHWFSDSIRFGINAFHIQQIGGLAGTSGIPIATGGYINQINENQANAEMYLYFF